MNKRALMVVAKQPAPGQTKTRLSPPLSGHEAAALYECFLRDTLEIIRVAQQQLAFDPIICYLPLGAETYFRTIAPDFGLLPQQGTDLSERLHQATSHCLNSGYTQAVIMDSDSPTLPPENLVQAFLSLDNADISLGRCDDGGYYLIGLKQPTPDLFLKVVMSTSTVSADTLEQARKNNLQVALLPICYDIDFKEDLFRLQKELATLTMTTAQYTRQFLAANLDLTKLGAE